MPDLSFHRMNDYSWIQEYISQRGQAAFDKFTNDVYRFLLKMKPGSFFNIEGNVKSENTDLFIKVCCMFINEKHQTQQNIDTEYIFSNDYTKIIHRGKA